MELIPCSHVGHLFRESTYSFGGDEAQIKARNNVRLVEVWMSDVRDFYYAANPCTTFSSHFETLNSMRLLFKLNIVDSQNISPGDLTDRIELKKRLKCKDFRWYLNNVYPESIFRKEFIDFVQVSTWWM